MEMRTQRKFLNDSFVGHSIYQGELIKSHLIAAVGKKIHSEKINLLKTIKSFDENSFSELRTLGSTSR